ncbi:metal-dependent hydrolase [Niallia circulans]|uniref:Hydrolase n=1 Tax=Niallia circulans TaxID=1397 RepID=A0A0J1ILS7_NIACI|nr:metal-dependent hydrolase [Niallia circulans]KLV26924.1 hydrolase [Niallia circulans]MCM2979378.1 metal-dependent hydrolase [Niallia circulans]MDR4316263.1 metal-dependent hydrolase [Niallia circulans]MED3839122.1 metal-dependent hydrolase [Niallia circulans]MED4245504.1 metal-dependent hydrolase [Niallia circulans]
MNGTSHAVIGSATGFIVANTVQSTPSETLLFVSLGAVSGLIPDLDIDGKLRGKITLPHQMIQLSAQVIGIMMILYSFFDRTALERWMGVGIGILILFIASLIKQKHMLTITGIAVLMGGISLEERWIILLGIYIMIASFTSHRSYTHSILGVIFFGIIAADLETSLDINGLFYTCIGGYISHLLADLKILPVNKRGVKLFLPLSSKEF